MSRSGRAFKICALRRRDAVPTRAPSGRSASVACVGPSGDTIIKMSRASPRGGIAAVSRPGVSAVGRSFKLCTARSIEPSRKPAFSSSVNNPLPPISAKVRSRISSPLVEIFLTVMASAGSPPALCRAATICSVWARASGDARVPMVICRVMRWAPETPPRALGKPILPGRRIGAYI